MPVREFAGTSRFVLRRKIGTGGMGAVYEVFDRDRGDIVALKTLLRTDAAAIYRLKEEFRTLVDVAHPNLVTLHELVAGDDGWFFTMELVDGINFLSWVRHQSRDAAVPPDIPRLRSALTQLAQGVHALHQAGKLHLDLKPPNVLVTPAGRVVILDFGISSDEGRRPSVHTREEGIHGTPVYMAPEQADGHSSAASDWYALGTMLYEGLTGTVPYDGTPFKVLIDKQERDADSPATRVAGLPEDLVRLCVELLARRPEDRPRGEVVLQRLGVGTPGDPVRAVALGDTELVGRDESLSRLVRAFREMRSGSAVTVYVYGPSGIGKSALARHFVDEIVPGLGGTALSGRCYEREAVPYKALDGIVDSLTWLLRDLPDDQVKTLLPADTGFLIRVFPVLSRVPALDAAGLTVPEIADPHELRRRAFSALRDLLRRLAQQRPLALFIDDLHWADLDSVQLLDALLARPDAPPLLLIACFRSEEVRSSPFLRAMLSQTGTPGSYALALGPLSDADSRTLAQTLLARAGGANATWTESVVQESGGSPFLAEQLARYVARHGVQAGHLSLPEMLERSLGELTDDARQLLDVLAAAGRPLGATIAREAAGLPGDERPAVAALTTTHLVRATGVPPRLEIYHDRLREALAARLDPERGRQIHREITAVLERRGFDDPEVLLDHALRAGEIDRVKRYTIAAAERSMAALAFDRAVTHFERALELSELDQLGPVYRRLGDALAAAGRGARAAEAYLQAAEAAPEEALELRRRAAEQLLITGHLEEGLAAVRSVLETLGFRLARTPRRALLSLIWRRFQLRLRGLRYRERPAAELPVEEINRIDTCWALAVGLGLIDNIRAADFQTLHLLLALRAGEPHRIARALAIEAGFTATSGWSARERSGQLLERSRSLAERIGSPYALALYSLISSIRAYYLGRWRECLQHANEAARRLSEQGSGVAWELSTARLYQVYALYYLGDLKTLSRLCHAYLRDAQDRGNLFAGTIFRSGLGNVAWLAADEVEEARRMVREAIADWPQEEFRIPQYLTMLGDAQLALYAGDGARAARAVSQAWPGFVRSHLPRIQNLRINGFALRARAGLASAAPGAASGLLRGIERDIERIEREQMPWSNALAVMLRAGLAATARRPGDAVRLLVQAEELLRQADMPMHAAAARRRRGELLSGGEGGALVDQADQEMRDQGIVNPERMVAMYAPGFGFSGARTPSGGIRSSGVRGRERDQGVRG